jgi:hypothetical protein
MKMTKFTLHQWVQNLKWDGHPISGKRHISVLALLRFLVLLNVVPEPWVDEWEVVDITRRYARRHYK